MVAGIEGGQLNTRRKVVIALGAGALTAPFGSFAQQQGKVWRIGFLSPRHVDFIDSDYYYGPFRRGMRELGYVEGKNLVIEWRSAEGESQRLPGIAAELVNLKVDVIVTGGTPATRAAQKATATIPIVMGSVGDPVGYGFVKTLARPDGNITGMSNMASDLREKQFEMLFGMVPKLSRLAILINDPRTVANLKNIEAEGQKRGVAILRAQARSPAEIDIAFSSMRQQKAEALMVTLDPFLQQQKNQIVQLAAKHRLPAIAAYGEYAEAGGLMSYGANLAGVVLRTATYVDKILKGAKPGDLPVEQPTKFELFINGKTAKALGLKIPQSLLISAEKVIE
jgi:putative ABC transport system substrate-binding protein